MRFVVRWDRLLLCLLLVCPLYALAEPRLPRPVSSAPPASAASQPAPGLPSRMQCTPVTPDTKVPWIEVSQLPDLTKDFAYFEACSDLDTAWTTQSYPDPKFVPARTPEHEERVARFLQGVKAFVAAESEDWVGYVNGWLGVEMPMAEVDRRSNTGDSYSEYFKSSYRKSWSRTLEGQLGLISMLVSLHYDPKAAHVTGVRDVTVAGFDQKNACITAIDLQKAFADQPGYLFRPMSVRSQRERPNAMELAQLGGQWFGYEVFVFDSAVTGHHTGTVAFGFGFRPCAGSVTFRLKKTRAIREPQ